MMTVMAGATIAPSLPEMTKAFSTNPNAEVLVKLVLTIPGLFIAITAPFSGWIIDRYGRIRFLVAMLLLYAIAGSSGLYLNTLLEIIVGRAFLGIAVGGIMTTAITLIGDYYEGSERQQFLGTQAAIMALSGTVFISGGGFLADVSWRYPFLIYLLAVVAAIMVVFILNEPQKAKREQTQEKVSIPKLAWTIYLISFLGMVTFYVIPVQVPFLIAEISEVRNTETGLAISLAMLIGGITSFQYPKLKKRLTHYQLYGITFLFMGLGYALISQANGYWMVIPGLMVSGLGAGLMMPNSNLCLVTMASPENRGKVLGFLSSFIFIGQFASPLFFQPLVDNTSIKTAFLIFASALVLFSIIALIRNRRLIIQQ